VVSVGECFGPFAFRAMIPDGGNPEVAAEAGGAEELPAPVCVDRREKTWKLEYFVAFHDVAFAQFRVP
jgi:hypothetical protein